MVNNRQDNFEEKEKYDDLFGEIDKEQNDLSQFKKTDIPTLILFWLLVLVVFLQFFTRYFLNYSFTWTEEASRYLLILTGFTGSVMCSRRGSHIALEFFYRYIPKKSVRFVKIFTVVCSGIFYTLIGLTGLKLAWSSSEQQLLSIPINKSYIYILIALSLFFMSVYCGARTWKLLRVPLKDV